MFDLTHLSLVYNSINPVITDMNQAVLANIRLTFIQKDLFKRIVKI